ncbi:MAG: hypothetical protein JNM84_23265 [Planctomycetes bacterium]|nr:hypothetical protein [Planctomycetota bacterium]
MKTTMSSFGWLTAALLSLATTARAVEVDIKLGDQFEGLVRSAVDEDRLQFSELEGTLVSATVSSKDGLLPTVRLWSVGASQFLDIASFLKGTGTSKLQLSKFPLPSTGVYQLVIGGTGTFPSTYLCKTKRKEASANKTVTVENQLANGQAIFVQEFDALGGSEISISVKEDELVSWNPTIDLLEDPNSNAIDLTGLVIEGTGKADIKKLQLPTTSGTYRVRVASRDGGFGAFKLTIKVKAAKSKAKIQEPASPEITEVVGNGFETGVVNVAFTLYSFATGTADVNAFYEDPNNPGTFVPATVSELVPTGNPVSLPGLATSRAGSQHVAQWSVRTDLGARQASGFVFRLEVIGGGIGDSTPFAIDTRGTFVVASSELNSARVFHTSNLLPDGRLLVAGGQGAHQGSSHELGDFSGGGTSATFTETHNSLRTPRQNHTSVSLPGSAGNRVVLVGGQDPLGADAPLATSEYFDPTTGTFTATGPNQHTRLFSASDALADDRVATFGNNDTGVGAENDTAELLDSTQGLWSHLANTMAVGRTGASATRLADGRVLVAGGTGVASTGAEIFDPATTSFTTVGAMVTERAFHTAQRLIDGRVLILGGVDTLGNPTASVELFDPATGTFSAAAENMATPRAGLRAVRVSDGRVLVAGGRINNSGVATDLVEYFRPGTDDFTPAGTLATARHNHTMDALPDGRVVVVGGLTSDPGATPLASVEIRLTDNGSANTPPVVNSITNPGASSGNVTINYILADAQDENAEITVRWRPAGGNWRQATGGASGNGVSGLPASAAGTALSFVWDSLADTGTSFTNTVEIEITPFGAVPGTSSTVTFSLSN